MRNTYIAIEGNIGVGKTTLARLLADALGGRMVLEEFADNNFLPKFYADPERYAFPLELSFLADRYKQLKEFANTPELFEQTIISDYLFIKSKLFARINLAGSEYELFSRVFDVMDLHIRQRDALLFLHAPVATLLERIAIRGRDYEQAIGDDYLERVEKMYQAYLATASFPVIMIDTSIFDFQQAGSQLKSLTDLLSTKLEPIVHYLR